MDEQQQIAQDIMKAVRCLLDRNDQWGASAIEVNALLMPGVTIERTLLTKQEREDLIEYLQILGSTTEAFDYPENIVVTINTLAADGRGNPGGRRRPGFLSDYEQMIFDEVAKTFLAESFAQEKHERIDEVYQMRHTVI
jgi:hypothetical protein